MKMPINGCVTTMERIRAYMLDFVPSYIVVIISSRFLQTAIRKGDLRRNAKCSVRQISKTKRRAIFAHFEVARIKY
jgi:hypothetical protein